MLRFSSEGFINLKVAIFPKSHRQSMLSCFLVFASLTSKKWYLSLALICFSLIMSEFEHFLTFEGHLYILFFCEFSVYWALVYCPSSVLWILGVLASCLWIYLPNILSQIVTCLRWFKNFYTMKKSLVLCGQVTNILFTLHFDSWCRKLFPIPQLSLFPVVLLSSFIFCCYNPIYRLGDL